MPVKKTLSAGQSEPLYNGTEIEFIGGYPAYTASIVNGRLTLTAKDVNLAKTIGFPASIEATKSPFTVGRHAKEVDFVLSGNSSISRSHGVFSLVNGIWSYSHYGMNNASINQIERAIVHAEEPAISHQTIVYRHSTPIKEEIEPFEIVSGTIFQFHPHLPCYEARVIDDKLVLNQTSGKESDARYPSRISVYSDNGITLGRNTGSGRVALPHPKISSDHATIKWDRESKAFIYTSLGANHPIIRIPQVINQTIVEPQKQIPSEEIKRQKSAIKDLKGELAKRHFNLQSVGELERHTVYTPAYKIDKGAHSEESLDGYALWLKAFELINHDDLSEKESKGIKFCTSAIEKMKEAREMIRTFEDKARRASPKSFEELRKATPNAFNHYVEEVATDFEKNGTVILLSGFHHHHAVASIYKQAGKTYLAEYNAGGGAKHSDKPGYVYGTYVREIKLETNVKELIWNISNRKIWGKGDAIGLALEKKIGDSVYPQPTHKVEVPAQHKGNCTTRSTREMLRHYLGEKLTGKIHEFVSDPERLNKLDMIDALNAKLSKLEALEKNGKANTLIGGAGPAIEL